MDRINIRNITDITENRIFYRDNRGDIAFIELESCANSYEVTHNVNVLNKDSIKVRCVGERFFGEYAYYELYTVGHTQLYLNLKTNPLKFFISKITGWNFHAKEFKLFYSVQQRLNSFGWTTFDLT